MKTYTATYSPDDNKLRLYSARRLDKETYERVTAAGFRWAPKQGLFVAPMWTPAREDLLIELAGELGDEDTSLVERAEQRAERFSDYSDKRAEESGAARRAVDAIAEGIPLGQPIMIGHHSEKHARRDAERIENGMRKTIRLWETSEYWKSRAAGALRHAKYKERPDVRARRIKKIEADKRKQERGRAEAAKFLSTYQDPDALQVRLRDGRYLVRALLGTYEGGLTFEQMRQYDKSELTFEKALETAIGNLSRSIAWYDRWIAHYENRLTYERALLDEAGGIVADRIGPEKGGGCKCWASPRGGWSWIVKVNKVSVTVLDNWGNGGENFTRTIPFDKLSQVMTRAQVEEKRAAGLLVETTDKTGFYLRETPGDDTKEETPKERNQCEHAEASAAAEKPNDQAATVEAMREHLRAGGVQVVVAPQLYPTPRELAERVADLADIQPGHAVLEPSAGTGMLLGAMGCRMFTAEPRRGEVVAVEINPKLAQRLEHEFPLTRVVCGDFLEQNGLGTFDRIAMNPPFEDGQDIKHILHAFRMLRPGGRLVAICANGPRQRAKLQPLVDETGGIWEDLPRGTFEHAGTGVNAALVVLNG